MNIDAITDWQAMQFSLPPRKFELLVRISKAQARERAKKITEKEVMHKKMKAVLSGLPTMASAYVPGSVKQILLEMAAEIDRLRAEVDQLRSQTDDGK